MVQREWGSAVEEFYARDNVEVFMMYPGIGTLALHLNRDQQIARQQEITIKQRELIESRAKRLTEIQDQQYKTKNDAPVSR